MRRRNSGSAAKVKKDSNRVMYVTEEVLEGVAKCDSYFSVYISTRGQIDFSGEDKRDANLDISGSVERKDD
jgi:hypothetical protein